MASIARQKIVITAWTWQITIFDEKSPMANPEFLGTLTSLKSFHTGKDMCNSSFWGLLSLYISLTIVALVFGVLYFVLGGGLGDNAAGDAFRPL